MYTNQIRIGNRLKFIVVYETDRDDGLIHGLSPIEITEIRNYNVQSNGLLYYFTGENGRNILLFLFLRRTKVVYDILDLKKKLRESATLLPG